MIVRRDLLPRQLKAIIHTFSRSTTARYEQIPGEEVLRDDKVKEDEVKAALRGAGLGDLADASLFVLETDGSLSVIPQANAGARTGWPQESPR